MGRAVGEHGQEGDDDKEVQMIEFDKESYALVQSSFGDGLVLWTPKISLKAGVETFPNRWEGENVDVQIIPKLRSAESVKQWFEHIRDRGHSCLWSTRLIHAFEVFCEHLTVAEDIHMPFLPSVKMRELNGTIKPQEFANACCRAIYGQMWEPFSLAKLSKQKTLQPPHQMKILGLPKSFSQMPEDSHHVLFYDNASGTYTQMPNPMTTFLSGSKVKRPDALPPPPPSPPPQPPINYQARAKRKFK